MLIQREQSCLLIVDVQEKLTPLVRDSMRLVERCAWLMQLAEELSVPFLVSEQYRRGLGETVEVLRLRMPGKTDIDKVFFSCYRDASFVKHWQAINRKQVILAGIETHVCILQTALDMHAAGMDVFVVVDAISSRHEIDHDIALQRMMQAGIHLVTSEMIFFEWLEQAGTKNFKQLSQKFLKKAHA